ncbi:MAG: hypothetical protein ACLUBL_10220 [Fusobacterium sp.]|uniref:hypothetical protein n=1 Tax=Fusobacterium sp. TaxID=68766 RepID=UPI00399159C8
MEFFTKFFEKISTLELIILFAAYFLGIKFPDWDFKLKLKHRSILTHSPLVLLFLIRIYEQDQNEVFRYFLIGFAIALALHFIFDLYPKGWGGGALLKIPILKISCTPQITRILLILFIVLCSIIAVGYTKNTMEFICIFSLGVFTILKDMKKEGKLLRPFFSYTFFLIIIGCIKYKEVLEQILKGVNFITKSISTFF